MNKVSRYMQNYLLYGFPFMLALIVWSRWSESTTPPQHLSDNNIYIKLLHELLAYNLMLWFLTLAVYMFLLVAIPSVCDNSLRRLANIQERDEREEYITGKAARSSYISSLSLIIFLLFFSITNINLSRLERVDLKQPKYTLSIGFHYSVFNKSPVMKSSDNNIYTVFNSSDYTFSSTTILFILLLWQLIIFNIRAKIEK